MIHQILGSNAAIDPNGDHFRLDTVKASEQVSILIAMIVLIK